MKILFIHQNFPGQFKHLAPRLSALGHEVTALIPREITDNFWQGVRLVRYSITRPNTPEIHPLVLDLESKVIRGEACLNGAIAMNNQSYYPDIIVAHPGWGESLFLKNLWPLAELKLYCEFFYHDKGFDYDFDPEFDKASPLDAGRVHLKNANFLLQWERAHSGLTPTKWQSSSFPAHIKSKLSVVHDGIDTNTLKPAPKKKTLIKNIAIKKTDEVITFVSRNLEPYRGFHIFMRALPEILEKRPNAQILIIGGDGVSYGQAPSGGDSWKTEMINEIFPFMKKTARERIHFLGTLAYSDFVSALQISTVHVYLTYPFILGWSLLEAMSCGCAIVGSKTQPVEEAISHGETGLLVNFFDTVELSSSVIQLLADSNLRTKLSAEARTRAVNNYDLEAVCLPKQVNWVLGKTA